MVLPARAAAAAAVRKLHLEALQQLGADAAPIAEEGALLQVCRHVGASRRKLNDCFRDVLGTSPLTYLRALRLNGVRRELRGGAASVQQAAARWGFWHLGELAADYRRQFGELPSQTLKQRR